MSKFFCITPLEVMAVYSSWPPLEVGVGYRTGVSDFLGMNRVEWGNTVCALGGKDSSVRQFAKFVRTDSIADHCESHMLVGTYFSAADKKCMEWFIMSSVVTGGCMRHLCKYSAVSVIINDLVFLSISWIQR